MSWNSQPTPSGRGGAHRSDSWLEQFRRRSPDKQRAMLTTLRESLERRLDERARIPRAEWNRAMAMYLEARAEMAARPEA